MPHFTVLSLKQGSTMKYLSTTIDLAILEYYIIFHQPRLPLVSGHFSSNSRYLLRTLKATSPSEKKNDLLRSGCLAEKGGVPQNGWWKSWKTLWKWYDFGGTPIFGNIHILCRNLDITFPSAFFKRNFMSPECECSWQPTCPKSRGEFLKDP